MHLSVFELLRIRAVTRRSARGAGVRRGACRDADRRALFFPRADRGACVAGASSKHLRRQYHLLEQYLRVDPQLSLSPSHLGAPPRPHSSVAQLRTSATGLTLVL